MTLPGLKYDTGKLRLDLLPPEAMNALGEVLTYGANKYGPNQWRGIEIERYEAALLRHWLAWKNGEQADAESGLPHLAHMLCNAAFMVALDKDAARRPLAAILSAGSDSLPLVHTEDDKSALESKCGAPEWGPLP